MHVFVLQPPKNIMYNFFNSEIDLARSSFWPHLVHFIPSFYLYGTLLLGEPCSDSLPALILPAFVFSTAILTLNQHRDMVAVKKLLLLPLLNVQYYIYICLYALYMIRDFTLAFFSSVTIINSHFIPSNPNVISVSPSISQCLLSAMPLFMAYLLEVPSQTSSDIVTTYFWIGRPDMKWQTLIRGTWWTEGLFWAPRQHALELFLPSHASSCCLLHHVSARRVWQFHTRHHIKNVIHVMVEKHWSSPSFPFFKAAFQQAVGGWGTYYTGAIRSPGLEVWVVICFRFPLSDYQCYLF